MVTKQGVRESLTNSRGFRMIYEVVDQATGEVLDQYREEQDALQVSKDYRQFGFKTIVVKNPDQDLDPRKVVKERY